MDGKDGRSFESRIERREFPAYPRQNDESAYNNINDTRRFCWWEKSWSVGQKGHQQTTRHVLYEGVPFAVVRWTNVFLPAGFGFFGDSLEGPLALVFGTGIHDVAVGGNTYGDSGTRLWRHRKFPAAAHSYYFRFPDDSADAVATQIRSDWISRPRRGSGRRLGTSSRTNKTSRRPPD